MAKVFKEGDTVLIYHTSNEVLEYFFTNDQIPDAAVYVKADAITVGDYDCIIEQLVGEYLEWIADDYPNPNGWAVLSKLDPATCLACRLNLTNDDITTHNCIVEQQLAEEMEK
jgi:hypothetical protein